MGKITTSSTKFRQEQAAKASAYKTDPSKSAARQPLVPTSTRSDITNAAGQVVQTATGQRTTPTSTSSKFTPTQSIQPMLPETKIGAIPTTNTPYANQNMPNLAALKSNPNMPNLAANQMSQQQGNIYGQGLMTAIGMGLGNAINAVSKAAKIGNIAKMEAQGSLNMAGKYGTVIGDNGAMAITIREASEADLKVAAVGGAKGLLNSFATSIRTRGAIKVANNLGYDPENAITSLRYLTYEAGLKRVASMNIIKLAVGGAVIGVAGVGLYAANKVADTDTMIDWYALDNVVSGATFYRKGLLEGIQSGTVNPIDALEQLERNENVTQIALDKVEASLKLNPYLLPQAEMIRTGMSGQEAALDLISQSIKQAAADYEARGGKKPPTWAEERMASELAIRELKVAWDLEDAAKWEQRQEETRLIEEQIYIARQADEAADAELWEQRAEENRKYWTEWQRLRDIQKEEERAYWEQVRKQQAENTPSKLGFGII